MKKPRNGSIVYCHGRYVPDDNLGLRYFKFSIDDRDYTAVEGRILHDMPTEPPHWLVRVGYHDLLMRRQDFLLASELPRKGRELKPARGMKYDG